MIRNIFLPDHIGNYYFFSQRIVGIDIQSTTIIATEVLAHGSKITIEKVIEERLDANIKNTNERIIAALALIKAKIHSKSIINASLDSSLAVFKELTLPFLSREKIAQVIGYEVEPLLPFARDEAIIDFIITKQDQAAKNSQVLAIAIQKSHIAQLISRFEQAELPVMHITVDTCALYELYKIIPTYNQTSGTTILWDITSNETKVALIQDGQLRIIRSLPYGSLTIAKQMGEITKQTPAQAFDYMMRMGLSNTAENQNYQALSQAFTDYFSKMQFALNTMLRQTNSINSTTHMLLLGHAKQIKGFQEALNAAYATTSQDFDASSIKDNPRYAIAASAEPLHPLSLAIALPISECNFRKGPFELPTTGILLQQLIWGAILVLFLLGMLIAQTIIQTQRLRNEKQASEMQAVEMIKERFPEIPEDMDTLDEVYEEAQGLLQKEQAMWGAFSNQSRAHFLEYLLELTMRINKQKLGFVPKQLTITDREMTLVAKVNDFEALTQLEESLSQSKLFTFEKPPTPEFTMKIFIKRTGV